MHLRLQRDADSLHVELAGNWRGKELPAIDAELAAQSIAGARELVIAVPETVTLDLAGAWTLREWIKSAERAGLAVRFEGATPGQLALIDATVSGRKHPAPPSS